VLSLRDALANNRRKRPCRSFRVPFHEYCRNAITKIPRSVIFEIFCEISSFLSGIELHH
jgi:hypothetical protein